MDQRSLSRPPAGMIEPVTVASGTIEVLVSIYKNRIIWSDSAVIGTKGIRRF